MEICLKLMSIIIETMKLEINIIIKDLETMFLALSCFFFLIYSGINFAIAMLKPNITILDIKTEKFIAVRDIPKSSCVRYFIDKS